jgi:UDP-N-acetylglucosamine 2-epimerase (non-hydrolysing)
VSKGDSLRDQVIFVAGARPNFMKIAPVLREWARRDAPVESVLVHTGQHYDVQMSDVFFRDLAIPAPDFHLEVGSGSHGAQTGRVIEAFESLLVSGEVRPRGVVVVGDVNSTMACTLASVKLGIPVAHIESGLRSFDRTMPEEVNRLVTDALAEILFVTETSGRDNLLREGVDPSKIHFVGNVMIDTLSEQLPAARDLGMAERLGLEPSKYALVTLHRPSNVDRRERLEELVSLLVEISHSLSLVFPMHPRTRKQLERFELLELLEAERSIRLVDPLGYRENLGLMTEAAFVLTDSGGIQEETTFLRVPCITVRPNTERPVTIELGTNVLVGEDLDPVRHHVREIQAGRFGSGEAVPMWDGHASRRIVDVLFDGWEIHSPSPISAEVAP